MRSLIKGFSIGIMAAALLLLVHLPVQTEQVEPSIREDTVEPSHRKDDTDFVNISVMLREKGSVTLKEGETYFLTDYIRLNSHNSIDATGAKIIVPVDRGVIRNDPANYKTDYSSMTDVEIKGGTWVSLNENGYDGGTSFSFAHCQDIRLSDMNIRCTNAKGHAIELVACKNVTIDNCTIIAQGQGESTCREEMVQIDMASPNTAPFLNETFQNGLPCRNITVTNCTITGCRGLCAMYASDDEKNINKYHDTVIIKNNTIVGTTSEALALFNTINAEINGNRIITKSKRVTETVSVGCKLALLGDNSAFSKGKAVVKNNVIKGGRQGFVLKSDTASVYGSLEIKDNKLFCKQDIEKNALKIANNSKKVKSVNKVDNSGNKFYKW